MKFIKQRFLAMRAKTLSLKAKLPRFMRDYRESKRIGVIYQADHGARPEQIGAFIERLKKEGKEVKSLAFFDRKPKTNAENMPPHASSGEISLFGKIKSKELEGFLNEEFDYIYCIANTGKPSAIDHLAAMSHAHCRVGRYAGDESLYDMMINLKPGQDVDTLMDAMLKYSKTVSYS